MCIPLISSGQESIRFNQPPEDFVDTADNDTLVFTRPEYPGGESAFLSYLENSTLRYNLSQINLLGDVITFQFTINKKGEAEDFQIINSTNYSLNQPLETALLTMPKWEPGKVNNRKKNTVMIYTLRFRPVNDNTGLEVTKETNSTRYTNETKHLKYFIMSACIMALLGLYLTR